MRNLFLLLLTSPCSRAWDLQSWWARGVCRDTMGQPDPAPAMLCLIEHVDERATQRQRQRERDGLRKSARRRLASGHFHAPMCCRYPRGAGCRHSSACWSARRRRGVVGQCVVTNVPHHSALSHASLYILSTGWSRKCPPPAFGIWVFSYVRRVIFAIFVYWRIISLNDVVLHLSM